jgi:ubiquinone biosynthesis protein
LQLDPELDLWKTAKPWLERWMSEQVGWRGFWKTLKEEAPHYATLLPQLPRLLHQRLSENPAAKIEAALEEILAEHKHRNALLELLVAGLLIIAAFTAWFTISR